MIARRTFIKGASVAAITATASGIHVGQSEAQQVPNSVGAEPPKLKAPTNAADCHMHTYDPAHFPMPPNPRVAPTNATVEDYRLLQKRIGTTRVVIVQPRNYATDNRVTLYAISQLGPNARGVAVVTPAITDTDLKAFHAGGIRGIRFSLSDPSSRAVTPEMVEPLSKRVADLGWHVQFNVDGEMIDEMAPILRRLPTPMVFDHLARPPLPAGIEHCLRDAIGTGEIGLHFAIGKPLKGFCALVRCESSGTTEAHATGFSTGSAVAGTGEDQLAFEFGQASKNSHHQAAMRVGRVSPGVMQRLKACATLGDVIEDIEQVPR